MSRTLMAASVALCIAAVAQPASAQIYGNYNDRQSFDFRNRANEGTFDNRLRLAARQWCGERMGRVTIREYLLVRECKREFTAEALAAGGIPAARAR